MERKIMKMKTKVLFWVLAMLLCWTVIAEASYVKAFDIDETTGMYLDAGTLRCEMGKRREAPFYGIEGAYFSGKFYIFDKRTGEKIRDGSIPMAAIYCNLYQGFAVMVERNVFHKSAIQNIFEGLSGKKSYGSTEKEEIHTFYNGMTGESDNAFLLIAECMWYTYTGKPSPIQNFVTRDRKSLISPIRYGAFRQKDF